MITIRFFEDCAPKDGSGITYKKDQIVELREDSAQHWIKRRKAVMVNGEIASPSAPKLPDDSFGDRVEATHEKRRGRKAMAVSGTGDANQGLATGDDV